jgi:hypothetical protein
MQTPIGDQAFGFSFFGFCPFGFTVFCLGFGGVERARRKASSRRFSVSVALFEIIMPDAPLNILPPVGQCIYCLATLGLTDEHIIPFSLGGNLVLPKASCKSCNKITHKFEGAVARKVFGQFRAAYDVQTRRPEEQPNHVKIRTKSGSLKWVPIKEVPDMLFVPESCEPELQVRPSPSPWGGLGTWAIRDNGLKEFQELHDWDGTVWVDTHPWHFGRMLAKIGYSYAVAKLGLGTFQPLVIDIIKGKVQNLSELIGTETKHQNQDLINVHELLLYALRILEDDVLYVAVDIRLFANHNLPKYIVIVGIFNSGRTVYALTDQPRYTQAIEGALS